MTYIQKGTPVFRKITFAFFAAGFNTFAILYCVQPLMEEFTREFHVTPTAASLSLSVTTMLLAVSMLVFGSLSEVWGRKPIMAVSMLAASVLCLASSFSPNFHTLLVLRTIQGVALAGLPSIGMAYLGEEIEPGSLGSAMGLYISGNAIGAVFGRIVSGLLSEFFNWHMAMGAIGVISLIASIIFFMNLPPSRHFTPRKLELGQLGISLISHLKDRKLLSLFLIGFLLLGSNVALFNYIAYVLLEPPYSFNKAFVSWIFIVMIVGIFSSSFIGRMVDQYGYPKILMMNIFIVIAGALLTINSMLAVKILGIALFTFGFFGGHSVASSWVGRRALHNKAQASSLYLFFYYAGSSICGTVGGLFWSAFHWLGVVGMIVIMLLVAFGLSGYLARSVKMPDKSNEKGLD
ncbi:MFS transporter [Bacillus subtilis]|nr:MFS transporter [Bacillus subtilis]